VLLGLELIHDLTLRELALDGLLVVGFDDEPRSLLHGRTSFPQSDTTLSTHPETGVRPA
jgi:hypothetical protein